MIADPSDFISHFEKLVSKHHAFAIIPHYNPDPDALGSSFGISFLLEKIFKKKATIYYGGIIGRAENNKMIQTLDIPVIQLADHDPLPLEPIILMDTQPGSGNNPLTKERPPFMIFDHHPVRKISRSAEYADIRLDYGSTCTLVYQYIKAYGLKLSVNVATALYYGIQTDVVGEGRNAFKIDFEAMEDLTRKINHEKLYSIARPNLPFDYYINIKKGLENSVVYDDFLISSLGELENPDYIGEIADFLIRFEKVNLVLVMGIYKNTIQISFRSERKKIDAGLLMKKIVGNLGTAGGHSSNAGGRIVLDDMEDIPRLSKRLITRSLELILTKITSGVPLLSLGDYLNY